MSINRCLILLVAGAWLVCSPQLPVRASGRSECEVRRVPREPTVSNDPAVPEGWPAERVTSAFHRELSLPLGGRQNQAAFVVPMGKRLVIEYASASAHVRFGQRLLVAIETSVNSARARHFLVPAWADAVHFAGTTWTCLGSGSGCGHMPTAGRR
jgi:hypothetical protein